MPRWRSPPEGAEAGKYEHGEHEHLTHIVTRTMYGHCEEVGPTPLMTHKYRGSQQSPRKVKPKFIDSTQGEPKNIYKP
jgi:hypothetical protein